MANNKMNIEGKNYSDVPVWRRSVSYTHLNKKNPNLLF